MRPRPSSLEPRTSNLTLTLTLVTFTAIRLPLFTRAALPLGWNSDAAVFGLMAKAIFERGAFPVYFFGQSYMGPLTSWSAVLVAIFTRTITPFELRLGVALLNAAAIVFYWLALRRIFGERAAAMAMLWVAIGPDYVMRFVIAPIGAEQLFFVSSVLFWYGRRLVADDFSGDQTARRRRHWFFFGILSGFGWWIHQGVVFVTAAVIAVAIARSECWSRIAPELRLRDRVKLCAYNFGTPARIAVHALQAVLFIDLVLGALHDFGLGVPTFFFFHPIAEPLAALLLLHALLFLSSRAQRGSRAGAGRDDAAMWRSPLAFIVGAVVGYAPVIIGAFTHAYPNHYSADAAIVPLSELAHHLRDTIPDIVPFLGNAIVAVFIIPAFAIAMFRFHNDRGPRAMALATIVFAFAFYFVSGRAHAGQMRYVVAALPLVYAFAAEQLARQRVIALVAMFAITIVLLVFRLAQVNDVRHAQYESYFGWLPNTDPRPILATINANGYHVCYADYWLAYKLEWLSAGKVEFIPRPGYDRRPAETRRLNALNVPKCYVDNDGTVRPVRPDDLDSDVSRRARAWRRSFQVRAPGHQTRNNGVRWAPAAAISSSTTSATERSRRMCCTHSRSSGTTAGDGCRHTHALCSSVAGGGII
jgi:hypothetical protein